MGTSATAIYDDSYTNIQNNHAHIPAGDSGQNPQDQDNNKKHRLLTLIVIFAIFAAVIGGGLAYLYNQSLYDNTASTLTTVTGSYEDTVSQLNAQTEASRLWISVSNTIHVRSDGTCYATSTNGEPLSVLDNITDNSKDIKYTFYLGDLKGSDSTNAEGEGQSTQAIYESGLISPGQSIESPILTTVPSSGVYDVTVTAQGYDVDTHTADGGTVSAAVTMIVE